MLWRSHLFGGSPRVRSPESGSLCDTPIGGSRAEEKLARSFILGAKLTLSSPSIRRANKDELPAIAGFLVDNSLGTGDRV
jgi:hypothetical protein